MGLDLTGQKFFRLLVIERAETPLHVKKASWWWKCKCDCGKEKITSAAALRSGLTKSCGCYGDEVRGIFSRKEYGQSAKKQVYGKYVNSAKKRNIFFDIDMEYFLEISQQNCFYCGCPPANKEDRKNYYGGFIYNGMDRIDNKKPYTKNNVVPCCGKCNNAKFKMSTDDFYEWIERIYKHSVAENHIKK